MPRASRHTSSTPANSGRTAQAGPGRRLVPVEPSRPVNYLPFEPSAAHTVIHDPNELAFLSNEWMRMGMHAYEGPQHRIIDHVYQVPYNGEKHTPTLTQVTGKKQFDFYCYEFSTIHSTQPWTIMWDHETGLVRTMSIFRALGHEKSTPAEALRANPGLSNLAPNITGGRIDIQGFWIPYDAALQLCLRFAYDLRAALYPVFGPAILRARPVHHPISWVIRPDGVTVSDHRLKEIKARAAEQEKNDTPQQDSSPRQNSNQSRASSPPPRTFTPISDEELRAGASERRSHRHAIVRNTARAVSEERIRALRKEDFGAAMQARSDKEFDASVGLMLLRFPKRRLDRRMRM